MAPADNDAPASTDTSRIALKRDEENRRKASSPSGGQNYLQHPPLLSQHLISKAGHSLTFALGLECRPTNPIEQAGSSSSAKPTYG